MEHSEERVASHHLPADEDMSESAARPVNQLGAQSQDQNHTQSRMTAVGWELQKPAGNSLQLDFQDSNLSPALCLLPTNYGADHSSTEYSLFQQSDMDFAPLRAYPDVSMASERFHFLPQDCTTQASDHGSLSQHPLAQTTILSEEGTGSVSSLSQNSLSPHDNGRRGEMVRSPQSNTVNEGQGTPFRDNAGSKESASETSSDRPNKLAEEAPEDDTFFLSKNVPAQHLLDILQRDIGMPSGSSSALSSTSETSVKRGASFGRESKSTKVTKTSIEHYNVTREGPPGEASLPQQQTQKLDQSRTLSCEVSNITMGSRSTQPDNSSEELRRELLSETERGNSHEARFKRQPPKSAAPTPGEPLTPYPTETSEGKQSVTRTNLGGVPWTGAFSTGVERGHRVHNLWSSGNQTGIDGSYLGFLPQSQSTPGVFKAPSKSSVKATLGQLSAIDSNKESSYQSGTGISSEPAPPVPAASRPDTADQCQSEPTSAKVHSLPSLNYMQKVDAWRENQSSGKTSLFDSLALQGFSGASPKKKAYDAVSDTLNHILTQQVRSSHQPPGASAANPSVTQNSSTVQSGCSSPRRGEAVGSAPSDRDNNGSATQPSASPFGRSQSHSSISTVVMSAQKHQHTERAAGKEKESQTQDDGRQQPSATVQPAPLVNLGQFSDVSFDTDLLPSSSLDSYNSGVKLGTSIGASSVVSLEVDNYVPYWTSKMSTPPPLPRPRELNIEERIPLYLHNLGIDQSPSTILTPFVPRGPIREPEFSPTDLCTIKGSSGTPTKSTQPSDAGSPHKGEFSRCSVLSAESSISIPFSMDSLGPAASVPEKIRTSLSSDTAAGQSNRRPAPCSQSDEDSVSATLQTSQLQQRDSSLTSSQTTVQLGNRFDSDLSLATKARCVDRDLGANRGVEQSAEDSFVGTTTLREIRKLLSQAENVMSARSSGASTASAVPRLLSDDDIFLSLRKQSGRLQDSSFTSSSSTAGEPRTQSPLLWARSSSDSMLTSEKPRESSIGQESMTSSGQPGYPSTKTLITAPGSYVTPQTSSSGVGGAGLSLLLAKSARRAEPEGCSAAPPDNAAPQQQPPVINTSTAASTQQQFSSTPTPSDTASTPEEEQQATQGGAVESSSSSPVHEEDTDQGVISDGSSESSLAVRVAKLLQSESPATMVSSTPSLTDHEESKAREWIKLKISGQQCEPLELDKEDRKRIEEIKRDLLLKNPMKSQGSTDTESSAASSVGGLRAQELLPRAADTFTTLRNAKNQASQLLHHLGTIPPDSSVQLQNSLPTDLETRIREIAAREGVALPRTNARSLTSITIASCRRSTSPSSSMSPVSTLSPAPEPLHVNELSTEAVRHPADRKLTSTLNEADKTASVFEPSSSLYTRKQNLTSLSAPENQRRQDAVGSQHEEPLPALQGLDREDETSRDDNSQYFKQDDELSIQDSSLSGVGAKHATVSTSTESQTRTGHISHVHLTLSPKSTDHSVDATVRFNHSNAAPRPQQNVFVPLRHSSPANSSPDEGVGSCSPLEWNQSRELTGRQQPERADTSTLYKPAASHGRTMTTSTQSSTAPHTEEGSSRSLTTETPAVPVLLPYKPRGSEELFYVPQTEADVSSTGTTMESTHTGSDDAVPPSFSSEVLGHQDPGLDRGVTIRHTEGIYSKRLKTTTSKMQELAHRDGSSQTTPAPKPSPQASVTFARVPSSSNRVTSSTKIDRGTSPVQFLNYNQPERSRETFQDVHVEMDRSRVSHRRSDHQRSVLHTRAERDQERRDADLRQQSLSNLDQLWQTFCERWSVEESRPTSDRESSLLERLERLSRLIHSTRGNNMSELQTEEQQQEWREEEAALTRKERRHDVGEVRRDRRGDDREMERKTSRSVPHQVWTQRGQVDETSEPAEEDSYASLTSNTSDKSSQSQHLRDESESLSTASGSMSTVDTARLIRAFGADRVQHLKTSSSLSKLYSTINKQKEEREQRRGRDKSPAHIVTLTETNGTDESTVAADSSSTSTYTPSSHHGPSRGLTAKRTIKLVSKGIQAGDLEIVSNGTRRHTRDVGTTFPSPGDARALRQISSPPSSTERGRRGQRSQSKTPGSQKQSKSKKTPSKVYPEGVSWFISADNLRADARKENRPEEEELAWRRSTAWFEPHRRTYPWREPLRQRQIHEDRNGPSAFTHHDESDPDPASKGTSSGLRHVTLQDALKMYRPEFISRSLHRMELLSLQVEERRLQTVYSRERDGLFNWPRGHERLQKPAGTALLRRAVPRKEMIQRSKLIYESLPEVQMRKEEQRRKAEYQTNRLNAQLYNKRITNRVLGRRTVWQ